MGFHYGDVPMPYMPLQIRTAQMLTSRPSRQETRQAKSTRPTSRPNNPVAGRLLSVLLREVASPNRSRPTTLVDHPSNTCPTMTCLPRQ